jgi:hypothetical protein
MQACTKPEVILPNNYRLAPEGSKVALLQNPIGKPLLADLVSEFQVSGPHVYGWIDRQGGGFFYLNTQTGEFRVLEKWDDLDQITDRLGIPRLTMKDSFSFMDLIDGYKKKTW